VGRIAAVVVDGVISRLGPLTVSAAIHAVVGLTILAGLQALGPRNVIPRVAWMSLETPSTDAPPHRELPEDRTSMPSPPAAPGAPKARQRDPAPRTPRQDTTPSESIALRAPSVFSTPAADVPTPTEVPTATSGPPEPSTDLSRSSTFEPLTAIAESESADATLPVPRHVVRHDGPRQDFSGPPGSSQTGARLGTATVALQQPETPGDAVRRPAELRGGYQVRPPYPAAARQRGIQGMTLLRVHVETDGRVGDVAVQQSAGHVELDRAASDAVRQWRFEPAHNEAGPVAMWVLIPVEFRLTDGR